MARILVNYIYSKEKDEFKILQQDCVFFDQKVAVLETEEDIKRPLVVPIRGTFTVVDWDRYAVDHKRFYLLADDKGNITEGPNGTEVWLPKDTDVSKLRLVNGQLVMVEEEPKEEKKEQAKKEQIKPKSKKESKTEA